MSLYSKNGCQYADGGFGNFIPIMYAIESGACEIDVIVLDEENQEKRGEMITNAFSLLFKTFKFMNNQNSSKDLIIGKLVGINKNIQINFYSTPTTLTDNPLLFDSEQMTQWWQDGYDFAKSKSPISFCHIPNAHHPS
jgi:predicted patatin/cPLA2 family phospholipase